MRKPFDKVWYMKHDKPIEGIIYFIEAYIGSMINPDKEKSGKHYKLSKKIDIWYFMITKDDLKNSGVVCLKERADHRPEKKVFNSKRELLESL